MCSVCCIHKIACLIGNEVVPPVVSFVQKYIVCPDWRQKYAALNVLGAILQGPDKTERGRIILPSFTPLLRLQFDLSRKVRESAAWVVSKIS